MFFLKRDTPLNSDEYEKLRKDLVEVKARIEELDTRLTKTYSELHSLRGKFYREKQDAPAEASQDLNTPFSAFGP